MTSAPTPNPYAVAPPKTGALAWWLGLLALPCVPFLGSLIAGVVMFFVGRAQHDQGALARENGRRAANWGLTYALATVVLVGAHFALVFLVLDGEGTQNFFPAGTFITAWLLMSVGHLVLSIWGGIAALAGRRFWGTGVPFVRADG